MRALVLFALLSPACVDDAPIGPIGDVDAGADAAPDPCEISDEDADGAASEACGGEDCDDADPTSYPGAPDEVGDLVDQSCDALDGMDRDGDAHASVESGGDDCDDGHADVHPEIVKTPGEDWILEVVDEGDTGLGPAIALDSEGAAHIVYSDTLGPLQYATNASGAWTNAPLDDGAGWNQQAVIQIDADDVMHVAYLHDNDVLRYATKPVGEGEWAIEDIEVEWTGLFPAMRIGGDGVVHLAWMDWGPDAITVEYATDATDWEVETVESPPFRTFSTALALDAAGEPHLTYDVCMGDAGDCWRLSSHQLRYAVRDAGEWTIENVTGDVGEARASDLVLDAAGAAHVIYQDDIAEDLVYTTNASGKWASEVLDSEGDTGWSPDIDLDPSGHVLIGFGDFGDGALAFVTNVTGEWSTAMVDVRGTGGYDLSLVLDARGSPHIAYFLADDWVLAYASTDGIDENCDGVDW